MKIRALLFLACALGGLNGAAASAATIVGQNVTLKYEFPVEGSVLTTTAYTIGNTTNQVYSGYFDFTMDDSSAVIDFNTSVGWTSAGFNGFTINDTNNVLPSFTGISLAQSTNAAFTSDRLSFSENRLAINWQGLQFDPSDTIRFNFTYAGQIGAVPEPASWALLIAGFGLVGGAMRSASRRKNLTLSYA